MSRHRTTSNDMNTPPDTRPTITTLTDLRYAYTPTEQLSGVDLAIISLVTETLDYARGHIPIEDLHQAVRRARYLAVPATPDNLASKQTQTPLPVPAQQH